MLCLSVMQALRSIENMNQQTNMCQDILALNYKGDKCQVLVRVVVPL